MLVPTRVCLRHVTSDMSPRFVRDGSHYPTSGISPTRYFVSLESNGRIKPFEFFFRRP